MKRNLKFLVLVAFSVLAACSEPQPKAQRDVSFVVVADTHFDLLPESDQYYHVLTVNRLEENFTWPEVAAPEFAGEKIGRIGGVVIAGDVFDKALPETHWLFGERYVNGSGDKTCKYTVFPGYGNHDIDPISSDPQKNLEGRAYNLALMDSILDVRLKAGEILDLHKSSRAYSWNVDDVHFINAQTFAGDTSYCESNLQWIKNDLRKHASTGNPVVFIQHYGFDRWARKWWAQDVRDQLFDILEQYNIVAFFVGHTHTPSVQTYRGMRIYQVNNSWPDRDGNGSFAVARIKGDRIAVASCRWTDSTGNFEIVPPYIDRDFSKKEPVKVMTNAFSHNDYERTNPLTDALSYGYNWVEADLHIVDGELYVMHDAPEEGSELISLEEMYLKPLSKLVEANSGSVYPGATEEFNLMMDFKVDGEKVYQILKTKLEKYHGMLSNVEDGKYNKRAVRITISGNRPFETLPRESKRYAFLDGRIDNLEKNDYAPEVMPLVSDSYGDYFQWDGKGEISQGELAKLRNYIRTAHKHGYKLRFWGAPKTIACKKLFLNEGIDVVGEDNLDELYHLVNNPSK